MEIGIVYLLISFHVLDLVSAGYPPTGDEVLPGSVLLPASRRGRYLANIVRRQAVDGTGIKFNKDADRMNAEAKKKVDVLSDELLPYIIAEQERRTTLYKRIMTAIQNGEKGVTIAEIRNKPPLIIRKGLMYRCPSNRAPKEPDGTGNLMCEEEIEPTQVMYDSCLSAEDKELFVTDNKFFFCNRHKVEGPDLPRNGTSVVGCPPSERTSLNYTTSKCALEDTEEVVVHYRYYPDRSYKFVTELDPDHEVCDHWNPCQIGYIFTLPSSDTASMSSELWQDAIEEYVHSQTSFYSSSARRIPIPPGYKFERLWAKRTIDNYGWNPETSHKVTAHVKEEPKFITVKLKFPDTWSDFFYSSYFAVFTKTSGGRRSGIRSIKFLTITMATAQVIPETIQAMHGQTKNVSLVPYKCNRCHLQGIMIRTPDGKVHNVDPANYRILDDRKTALEIDLNDLKPWQYGDYFAIIQNADGVEERVKVLSLLKVVLKSLSASLKIGENYDQFTTFDCPNFKDDCVLNNVMCNGESAVEAGRVSVTQVAKKVTFIFPAFEDGQSCVYLGEFKVGDHVYQKVLLIAELVSVTAVKVAPPIHGEQFEQIITFTCSSGCSVEKVNVNGFPLQPPSNRRSGGNSVSQGFYLVSDTTITIRVQEWSDLWEGIYQAIFDVSGEQITKTILTVGNFGADGDDSATAAPDTNGANKEGDKEDSPAATDDKSPLFTTKCKVDDEGCAKQTAESVLARFAKGWKGESAAVDLSAIKLDEVDAEDADGFKLNMKELATTNLACKFEKAAIGADKLSIDLSMKCPWAATGTCEVTGLKDDAGADITGAPAECSINIDELQIDFKVKMKLEEKKWSYEDLDGEVTLARGASKFNVDLSKSATPDIPAKAQPKIEEDATQDKIVEVLKPPMTEFIKKAFGEINAYFATVTEDDLFEA